MCRWCRHPNLVAVRRALVNIYGGPPRTPKQLQVFRGRIKEDLRALKLARKAARRRGYPTYQVDYAYDTMSGASNYTPGVLETWI